MSSPWAQRPASARPATAPTKDGPRAQNTIDLSGLNLKEGDTTTTVAIGKDTYTIGQLNFACPATTFSQPSMTFSQNFV